MRGAVWAPGWLGGWACSWQCCVPCAVRLPHTQQRLHPGLRFVSYTHPSPTHPPTHPPCAVVQGRQSYMDKRAPDFSRFKRLP